MRIAATLAGITAATALVAGTIAPATAATENHTDPASDTDVVVGAPSEESREAADVIGLRGRHGDGRLVVTVTVDDLKPPGGPGTTFVIARVQTPTGRDYEAFLGTSDGTKETTLYDVDADRTVTCDGLAGRVFAARDDYVLSIPRSCLRNPREVLFGVVVYAANTDGGGNPRGTRGLPAEVGQAGDDARRDGRLGDEIRLGRRALANN